MDGYLIINGLVLTMDSERQLISDGAVAIEENMISAVGKKSDLKKEYGHLDVIDAEKGLVLPGLVNAHSHLFAMFSRGLGADGSGKWSSRSKYFWDIDRLSLLDKEACRISADLACVEMIRSGITTTQDSHYINFHKDSIDGIAESVKDSGLRAVIGRGCWDAPGLAPLEMTEDVDTAVRESERFIRRWNMKANGRIYPRVEASMLAQCTDEMMKNTKYLSRELKVGWSTHLQYKLGVSKIDPRRDDSSLERYGGRAVEYMNALDLLGPSSLLIHCTYVSEREISILAQTGTPVAHCPLANAYGGNPTVTPVPLMKSRGVSVGLGTDSVATNDSLDIFQVMKFAALIHKVNAGMNSAMTAEKVLEMATIESAKTLNLEAEVGSLESGKKADVLVIKRDTPGITPTLNPVKNLVYGTGCNRPVDVVLVDGKIVYNEGEVKTIGESEVYDKIECKSREIMGELGRLDEGTYFNSSPWRIS